MLYSILLSADFIVVCFSYLLSGVWLHATLHCCIGGGQWAWNRKLTPFLRWIDSVLHQVSFGMEAGPWQHWSMNTKFAGGAHAWLGSLPAVVAVINTPCCEEQNVLGDSRMTYRKLFKCHHLSYGEPHLWISPKAAIGLLIKTKRAAITFW